MKRLFLLLLLVCTVGSVSAQEILKLRPDAFPPEAPATKAVITMAATVDEMASWDRYPTYGTYLAMMQQWVDSFPTLCHLDTIGESLEERLILSLYIEPQTDDDLYRPEFFYSSSIHGDELTGYIMMLRLIDTLLHSYGTDERLTRLMNTTRISINPLANPDGAYYYGDSTVQNAVRDNTAGVDLNRDFPDPFASGPAKRTPQQENQAMINYVSQHHFRLSANLHGGSQVMNYPWDSFTSQQNAHPQSEWWEEVCHRFVDTCRMRSRSCFRDVTYSGVVAGGDWYVIHGGRQDYINYYHDCLEVTMEISTPKTPDSDRLPSYWHLLSNSLINYIDEIHSLPGNIGITDIQNSEFKIHIYPNPATDVVHVDGLPDGTPVELYDLQGRRVLKCTPSTFQSVNVSTLPSGLYLLHAGDAAAKIIIKK